MRLPRLVLQHELQVDPLLGEGAGGPSYGDTVTVPCFFEGKRNAIDSAGASVTVVAKAIADLDQLDHVPVGSRVTAPDGRELWVRTVATFDPGRLPLPAHLEIELG